MTNAVPDATLDPKRFARTAADPDAPAFHLGAPYGRINDPNGLLIDGDTAHAFYQWGPDFPHHVSIGWGHATSTDLLRWTHQGMAFAPDAYYDRNGCYSGGAIARTDRPGADFLYTGNVKTDAGERESYQVHVSTDDFVTFEKNPAGPFIADSDRPDGYTAHFRDPVVYARTDGRLRMCIGVQRDNLTGAVLLYSAEDAAGPWRFDGELEIDGVDAENFGFMWECPNLFRIIDSETGEPFDVFVFSPQGITDPEFNPFGDADVCGYVIGHLEGNRLRDATRFRLLDSGSEFYAPQVFAGREGAEDALLLAWAGMAGADDQPTLANDWVHVLTVPRRLSLRGGILRQEPAFEREAFGASAPIPARTLQAGAAATLASGIAASEGLFTLDLRIEAGASARITVGPADAPLVIELDAEHLSVDRSATRYHPGLERRSVTAPAEIATDGAAIRRVELLVDRSVVEVFVDGVTAYTARAFFAPGERSVSITADAGTVEIVGGTTAEFAA